MATENITIKLTKLKHFTQNVRYLGHIIEPGKFSIDDTTFRAPKEENRYEISSN